ncbi:MAG: TolC family protein, partial [Desulfomonilaceae bacterium]
MPEVLVIDRNKSGHGLTVMGMERLRSVVLLPTIVALIFSGIWTDWCKAAPLTSSNSKLEGPSSASSSGAIKLKNNRLKVQKKSPRRTVPLFHPLKHDKRMDTAKPLTIKNLENNSPAVSSLDKCFPTYRQNNLDPTLSLPQAIQTALARNLSMADSRLAVEEKEYQRREAYSDFFPSITFQYGATWDRYWNLLYLMGLYGMQDSRYATGQQAYRFRNKNSTNMQQAWYPYRIDPFRQFTGSVTITQPIFSGGKLINDYKFARLGVDYSSIQYEVNRQDL